jgi:hypothetical protein
MGKLIHGKRKTRMYRIWSDMKGRCNNPNRAKYARYGGRGITVCDEWMSDFQAFYDWAIKNGYREDLTIDRIDNDGNYCPDNCRWITMMEQASNKSTNHFITHDGQTFTMTEWARRIGIPREVLKDRICRYGWECERALTTPVRKHKIYEVRS